MSTAQDVQNLLRFLAQDAKVPLAQAMSKAKELQQASLSTASAIAKSNVATINAIFNDEKLAKQILNAAKRSSKKRASTDVSSLAPAKRSRPSNEKQMSVTELEKSLELPESCLDDVALSAITIYTNRAPLVLAFAVTLLKFTMPEQPLSSRLSLAQAVVSANSRTKAANLGLEPGISAEEEGWGEGQPIVKIMGREIKVMKRWGYQWQAKEEEGMSQDTINAEEDINAQPALWGVDLEALRKQNGPATPGSKTASTQLPIYTAQSARAYLLKSFETPKSRSGESAMSASKQKPSQGVAEKERNLSFLLGALELLIRSWSSTLSKDDLDKRAWAWYVHVRPKVEEGVAGWGGKGNVKLADILGLRKA